MICMLADKAILKNGVIYKEEIELSLEEREGADYGGICMVHVTELPHGSLPLSVSGICAAFRFVQLIGRTCFYSYGMVSHGFNGDGRVKSLKDMLKNPIWERWRGVIVIDTKSLSWLYRRFLIWNFKENEKARTANFKKKGRACSCSVMLTKMCSSN
ncbi:hypothetical protein Ancab_020193 [Ancistrocladus abbreviatus]